ncbi:hypothetical protein INP83_11875 [Mucilaginibacter sp. 21P]|uniref:hypothetical protein n=1 Tax=Mucilaginibacter sp. 21P TaxID=2778902 RepID=UPI001C5942E9|nr:hypothetical protein [Mucilaginibacter sp. 21P]QXV63804.1 hypothetical protein INP83_11875 [Mucilaginibacter sp. 21P]
MLGESRIYSLPEIRVAVLACGSVLQQEVARKDGTVAIKYLFLEYYITLYQFVTVRSIFESAPLGSSI